MWTTYSKKKIPTTTNCTIIVKISYITPTWNEKKELKG
jgi:hypothetical protein